MSVDVLSEISIARPRDEVAAFTSEPTNAPRWYVNIKSARMRTEGTLRTGSRAEFVAQFLGRKLSYTYEVTAYEPGARLVMRTAEGPFPMETTYMWATTPDGATHMTLRNRGEPRGFSRLAAPLLAGAMRRANAKDLLRLKQLLEARA